jgi:FkbM family methyltransferase
MNEDVIKQENNEEQFVIEQPEWIKKGYPSEELMNWFENENDYHLLRNFDLNENSLVVDIGCYNGTWLKDMYCKYRCNCIGVEPITEYYESTNRILTDINKIKLYNYGLSVESHIKKTQMNMAGDASRLDVNHNPISVKMECAKDFFDSIKTNIDVLQINIEGYEYQLIPFLMKNDILSKVKNLQIQFHNFYSNSEKEMNNIISALQTIGFKTKFNYPFVWYGAVKQ